MKYCYSTQNDVYFAHYLASLETFIASSSSCCLAEYVDNSRDLLPHCPAVLRTLGCTIDCIGTIINQTIHALQPPTAVGHYCVAVPQVKFDWYRGS